MTDMLVRCGVCGLTKPEHADKAHVFDPGGNLIPRDEQPPPPRVVSSLDIALRLLLVDKGVITLEDLTLKEVALREQLAHSSTSPQRAHPG